MSDAPERVYIDRGPNGGWMYRPKRMFDTKHVYIRADLHQAALDAETARAAAADAALQTAREDALREAAKIAGNKGLSSKEAQAAILSLIPEPRK